MQSIFDHLPELMGFLKNRPLVRGLGVGVPSARHASHPGLVFYLYVSKRDASLLSSCDLPRYVGGYPVEIHGLEVDFLTSFPAPPSDCAVGRRPTYSAGAPPDDAVDIVGEMRYERLFDRLMREQGAIPSRSMPVYPYGLGGNRVVMGGGAIADFAYPSSSVTARTVGMNYGTLACVVQSTRSLYRGGVPGLFALTNAHIADPESVPGGSGRRANGRFYYNNGPCIGERISAVVRDGLADAAIVELLPGTQWRPALGWTDPVTNTRRFQNLKPTWGRDEFYGAFETSWMHQELFIVAKVGDRTGLTFGYVRSIAMLFSSSTGADPQYIEIEGCVGPTGSQNFSFFGLHGDSGSLVVTPNGRPLALYYASSPMVRPEEFARRGDDSFVTIRGRAAPIWNVFDSLGRQYRDRNEQSFGRDATPLGLGIPSVALDVEDERPVQTVPTPQRRRRLSANSLRGGIGWI